MPISSLFMTRRGKILALDDFKEQAGSAPEGVLLCHYCLVTHAASSLHDHEGKPIIESCFQRGPQRQPEYPYGRPEKLLMPLTGPLEQLDTVLFLPFVRFSHFGHMLTETAGWLSTLLDPDIDLLGQAGPNASVLLAANSKVALKDVATLLRLPPERVLCTTAIRSLASCRRVLIPRPSMINRRAVETRHFLAVQRLVNRWYGLDSDTLGDGARTHPAFAQSVNSNKVYLSRSKLSPDERHVIDEEIIERELERRGWRIVYPETLPISEQLAVLQSARVIAGHVGSAFHLLMYFGAECAGKTVIGLGMSNVKKNPAVYNFVFQFRTQGVDFRHLCCLRHDLVQRKKKTDPDIRFWDLRLTIPPQLVARQIQEIADRAL